MSLVWRAAAIAVRLLLLVRRREGLLLLLLLMVRLVVRGVRHAILVVGEVLGRWGVCVVLLLKLVLAWQRLVGHRHDRRLLLLLKVVHLLLLLLLMWLWAGGRWTCATAQMRGHILAGKRLCCVAAAIVVVVIRMI